MTSTKHPKDYSIDDVCTWINAIGFGDKADAIRENSVDGRFLVTLGADDYKELGFSSLQSKRVIQNLETTIEFAESGGLDRIHELEEENKKLRDQIKQLQGGHPVVNDTTTVVQGTPVATTAPTPTPPPPKQQQQQPPRSQTPPPPSHHSHNTHSPKGPGVVGGAAGGAVKGAVLGAVGGAVLGNAGKGAKLGAAVGGTRGAMKGLARR